MDERMYDTWRWQHRGGNNALIFVFLLGLLVRISLFQFKATISRIKKEEKKEELALIIYAI